MRQLTFLLLLAFSAAAFSQEIAKVLPFSRQQNMDNARWVWFVFGKAGVSYDYVSANDFSDSHNFREVKIPQSGDVAWWRGLVAIVDAKAGHVLAYDTYGGQRAPQTLESQLGSPRYYRYNSP
jgi:hypothetical protein